MKAVPKATRYLALALASAVLLAINFYAVKAFIVFGSPLLFVLALIFELLLALYFVYCLYRGLFLPERIVLSIFKSSLKGAQSNEYIHKFVASRDPFIVFVRGRLLPGTAFGLPLTITLLISSWFMFHFLVVLFGVTSHGPLTQIDTRVLNLIPSIRTPTQTAFLRPVTMLANTETAIILMLTTAVLFFRNNQKLLAGIIVFVAAGEESVTYILKQLVHRARPDVALHLIHVTDFSFPSGHVVRATVLFGFLAYVFYKTYASNRARLLTAGLFLFVVFLVAVSRVYLGVHYPSDVWASFLLGSSLLTLVVGGLEICGHYPVLNHKKVMISTRSMLVVPLVVIGFAVLSSPLLARIESMRPLSPDLVMQNVDAVTIQKLPVFSETLTGGRMEPINFVYVGYEDQVIAAFKASGWYRADPSTVNNTLKAIAVGFQGNQYLTAPVTPSFLNFQPETVAFEQSTATHSLRQRHHTRLWKTAYIVPDGRPIWEATASFDEGVKLAGTAKLPTHYIDPNIDAERAYITKSLGYSEHLIRVTRPQLGKNASGDSFFTDGQAQLIYSR